MANNGLLQNLGKSDGAVDKFYEEHTNDQILSRIDNFNTQNISHSQWKRVEIGNGKKKVNLINVTMSKEEFKKEVIKQADIFREHVDMVRNQTSERRLTCWTRYCTT